MSEKLIKIVFYGLLTTIVGVLVYFIMHNAYWIIGDDAIIIRYTGWGHYIHLSDFVIPSIGRFYPLAHIIYNVLPFLGLTSATAHFALHAIVFVAFCFVSSIAIRNATGQRKLNWQSYILVMSAILVCIARAYNNFLDAYSTIWEDYTLAMAFALCNYYVHERQSLVAAVVGLISAIWLTGCMETDFIFPLAYGIIGLLFTWNKSTKLEKAYYWSLVGTGIIFLLLYFFICFLHIEDAYDGAHMQELSIIGNAVKMLVAQKVLWVVLILICWRAYRIIQRKEEFEFWDTMLLTGCAYCCGCAAIKLNWVLYYSTASIFVIPAIVHYLHKYLGDKWAWCVMLFLALFTCRNIPGYVKRNQVDRKESALLVNTLANKYSAGKTLYWYAPEDGRELCFELDQRAWLYTCLNTLLGWQIGEETYNLIQVKTYEGNNGIYVLPRENNKLFPSINENIISAGEVIAHGKKSGFNVVEIQNAL